MKHDNEVPNTSPLVENQEDEPSILKLPFPQAWKDMKVLSNATLTTTLSIVYIYAANLISLAFVGQSGQSSMIGGLGLGFVCSNCCAYIFISSINQGVNTLASQAHGANQPAATVATYHRGLVLIMISLVPILALMTFTKPILMFFNIEEDVAEYAWEYIRNAFPSFLFFGMFDCTKSFMYALNIFNPVLFTQSITIALHFFWSWLFVTKLEMGPAGAGIAKTILELSNILIIFLYIYITGCCKENWVPFKKVEWKNTVIAWNGPNGGMKYFLSETIPMGALLFLDMFSYEVFAILAGQLGSDQLAVHVALANTITLYYSFPLGLSISVQTYVGQAMGKNTPNYAKNITYLAVILNVSVSIIFVSIMWAIREDWASLFATNEEMKDLLLQLIHIYFIFVFIDGVQVVLSGSLKGIGKQTAATLGLAIAYYVVAMPLIYILAFRLDMKIKGIWFGFLAVVLLLFIIYLFILGLSNFKRQSKKIRENFTD